MKVLVSFLFLITPLVGWSEPCFQEYMAQTSELNASFRNEFYQISPLLTRTKNGSKFNSKALLVLKYEMPQEFLHIYIQNGNPTDFGIDYSVIAYAVELDGERLFYEDFSDECKKPALVVSPGRSFHLMSIKPPPWPLQTGTLKVTIWGSN